MLTGRVGATLCVDTRTRRTGHRTRVSQLFLPRRTVTRLSATSSKMPSPPENTRNPKPTLLTFDVDGTLIRAVGPDANKWHKDAFAFAIHKVFGIDTTIDVIKHHGSTDQLVLLDVLRFHGFEEHVVLAKMGDLKNAMVAFAETHAGNAGLGLEILPGVEHLLKTLWKRNDVVVGLVTGNLEPIAWRKMETLGIKKYFSEPKIGGFGSDHADRVELVKIAAMRAVKEFDLEPGPEMEVFVPGVVFKERVHFGDTSNDVKAALAGGAVAVALTTGVFSEPELREHFLDEKRCALFNDLTDTDAVLRASGLEP